MIKEVKIGPKDLFTFENTALVLGDGVLTGNHTVELRKKGMGPLYFNAYLTVFTLETPIKKAGLEVKINRKYYLLKKSATEVKVPGARGEAVNQRGEKYERSEIQDLASVKSGDLVEIEMEILSKNDYEYILIEDMKAAGFDFKDGDSAIVPVMLYDAKLSQVMADKLLQEGIYVIGFFYPVVAKGQARIRTQISAAHSKADLDKAIAAFIKVGKNLNVI